MPKARTQQSDVPQWKPKYGGLDVSEGRRHKVIGDENAKLMNLFAEAMLDNAKLKDLDSKKMVTPVAARELLAEWQDDYNNVRPQVGAAICSHQPTPG